MKISKRRGRWVVETSEGIKKFSTQAEAESFAGLGDPVEEPSNGDEKEETYTEEFNFSQEEDSSEEEDSTSVIGVSEEDSESESEEE